MIWTLQLLQAGSVRGNRGSVISPAFWNVLMHDFVIYFQALVLRAEWVEQDWTLKYHNFPAEIHIISPQFFKPKAEVGCLERVNVFTKGKEWLLQAYKTVWFTSAKSIKYSGWKGHETVSNPTTRTGFQSPSPPHHPCQPVEGWRLC